MRMVNSVSSKRLTDSVAKIPLWSSATKELSSEVEEEEKKKRIRRSLWMKTVKEMDQASKNRRTLERGAD